MDLGPVDFCALARFAASLRSEIGITTAIMRDGAGDWMVKLLKTLSKILVTEKRLSVVTLDVMHNGAILIIGYQLSG